MITNRAADISLLRPNVLPTSVADPFGWLRHVWIRGRIEPFRHCCEEGAISEGHAQSMDAPSRLANEPENPKDTVTPRSVLISRPPSEVPPHWTARRLLMGGAVIAEGMVKTRSPKVLEPRPFNRPRRRRTGPTIAHAGGVMKADSAVIPEASVRSSQVGLGGVPMRESISASV